MSCVSSVNEESMFWKECLLRVCSSIDNAFAATCANAICCLETMPLMLMMMMMAKTEASIAKCISTGSCTKSLSQSQTSQRKVNINFDFFYQNRVAKKFSWYLLKDCVQVVKR